MYTLSAVEANKKGYFVFSPTSGNNKSPSSPNNMAYRDYSMWISKYQLPFIKVFPCTNIQMAMLYVDLVFVPLSIGLQSRVLDDIRRIPECRTLCSIGLDFRLSRILDDRAIEIADRLATIFGTKNFQAPPNKVVKFIFP